VEGVEGLQVVEGWYFEAWHGWCSGGYTL